MRKIRKALVAGGAAAGAALWAGLERGVPSDSTGWLALLGTAASAALVAGYATWRVENARA